MEITKEDKNIVSYCEDCVKILKTTKNGLVPEIVAIDMIRTISLMIEIKYGDALQLGNSGKVL